MEELAPADFAISINEISLFLPGLSQASFQAESCDSSVRAPKEELPCLAMDSSSALIALADKNSRSAGFFAIT